MIPLSLLIKEFSLPEEVLPYLEKYYVLRWTAKYFDKQTRDCHSILKHQNTEYLTIFQEYPNTIFSMATHDPEKQLELSFRKLKQCPYGYVLVRILRAHL